MADRHIDYMPIDEVPEATRNAKQHKRDAIARSIRTFGFTAPTVLDERTGQLAAGHGRLQALRWMRDAGESAPEGLALDGQQWLAPVVRGWHSRSDADAEALTVADNHLTELGGWDQHQLAAILEDAADHNPDLLEAAGYAQSDLDKLLADIRDDADPDFSPDDSDSPRLDQLEPRPCPQCGYDTANDPDGLRQ